MVEKQQVSVETKNEIRTIAQALRHNYPVSSAGTSLYSGFSHEDYMQFFGILSWQLAADKMHRSDGKMAELYQTTKRPIESAQWMIEPADESDEAAKVAEYVNLVFFSRFRLEDFLRESLTLIKYGFSTFEKVFKMEYVDGLGLTYVYKNASFISPKTVRRFYFDPETGLFTGLQQQAYGDLARDVTVKAENLLMFSFNREGADMMGIPPFRSAYKDWICKDELYKVLRRGAKNSALGVPIGTIADGYVDAEKVKALQEIFEKYANGEIQGITVPENTTITPFALDFDPAKFVELLQYYDRSMAKSFAASFTEIGSSGGKGGFAQSKNETALFLSGLESLANMLADGINDGIIKPLVWWYFGPKALMPKLRARGINDTDGEARATMLATLAGAGLISVSPEVGAQVHKEFKLPAYDEEYAALSPREKAEREEAQAAERARMLPQQVGAQPAQAPAKKKGKDRLAALPAPERLAEGDDAEHPASVAIGRQGDLLAAMMAEEAQSRADEYIALLLRVTPGKARSEWPSESIPRRAPYAAKLRDRMAAAAEESRRMAFEEVGMLDVYKTDRAASAFASLPPAVREEIKASVEILIDAQDARLKQDVLLRLLDTRGPAASEQAMREALRGIVKDYLQSKAVTTTAINYTSKIMNNTRNGVFQSPEVLNKIEAFQFSNSGPISAVCRNLNGKVFSKEEYLTTRYLPPLHDNCKSVIIPLMIDAARITTGLVPTGTPEEIAKIQKSIRFS